MSKTISAGLKAHLAEKVTTLAICWKLTRLDGAEFFFTNHDIDIDYGGDTYEAASGFYSSEVDQTIGLSVDNVEAYSFLESSKITEADIIAGLYDYAEIDIFLLNYEDLTQGHLMIAGGWKLGQVTINDNSFNAEVRGKAQLLEQNILDLYSPSCRAKLGDSECSISLVDSAQTYVETGSVTGVTDRANFTDSSRTEATDIFRYGLLTFDSGSCGGLNAGFQVEVKAYDTATKTFTLFEEMPYTIQAGDVYSVTWGCDKSTDHCKNRFSNLVNFRGEPFLPGTDKLLATPYGP